MVCRAAQHLIYAERDRALTSDERAGLQAHVSGCGACQRMRDQFGAAMTAWREEAASAVAPDPEKAWQDIHRAIRIERDGARRKTRLPWMLPLGAAAGLAVYALAHFGTPDRLPDAIPVAHETGAGVEFVDVPAGAASMVFVDDESGWVVVWSTPSADQTDSAP